MPSHNNQPSSSKGNELNFAKNISEKKLNEIETKENKTMDK